MFINNYRNLNVLLKIILSLQLNNQKIIKKKNYTNISAEGNIRQLDTIFYRLFL